MKDKLLKKFQKLVSIYSPSGEEQDMVAFMNDWLTQQNIPFKTGTLGNIYAYNKGTDTPKMICAHMDTVCPSQNIQIVNNNELLKSKGDTILGADNKATLAAVMQAVEDSPKTKSFELLFTVQEEDGEGFKDFDFKQIKSKESYIFDSVAPIGSIIQASPYYQSFEIRFIGKAAHISEFSTGQNSLLGMVDFLSDLKIGNINKNTTLNIGVINGGTGINTVPEETIIKGELRGFKKEDFTNQLINIENKAKHYADKHNLKHKFNLISYFPGYKHNENSDIITNTLGIYKELGIQPEIKSTYAVSNANDLNNQNIPTINLGDGVINAHTTDESIKLDDIERIYEMVKVILD